MGMVNRTIFPYAAFMSKGKRKRKHATPGKSSGIAPGNGSGQQGQNNNAIRAELAERIEEISRSEDEQAGPIWGAIHKLLLKMKVPPSDIMPIIAARDLDSLHTLLQPPSDQTIDSSPESSPPESSPQEDQSVESSPSPETATPESINRETLKKAMKAFRKRIKLIRLDHESKLGYGPMTGGRAADFNAIMPPQKYPKVVWEALVEDGQLKRAGPGFYMLDESADA